MEEKKMNVATTTKATTSKTMSEFPMNGNNNNENTSLVNYNSIDKIKEQQLIQLVYNEIYKDGGCTIVVLLKDPDSGYQLKNKINSLLGKQIKLIQFFEKHTTIFNINRNQLPHKVYLVHNNNNSQNHNCYHQQQQQDEDTTTITNIDSTSTTSASTDSTRIKLVDHICYILRRRNTKIERRQYQNERNKNQQQQQQQQQLQYTENNESYVNINWLLSKCISVFHLYLHNLMVIDVQRNNNNDDTSTIKQDWFYQTLYVTPDDVQIPGSKQWLQLVENEFYNFLYTNSNNKNQLMTATTSNSGTGNTTCRLQLKQFPIVQKSEKEISKQESFVLSKEVFTTDIASSVTSEHGTINNNSTHSVSYKYMVRLVEEQQQRQQEQQNQLKVTNNNQNENTINNSNENNCHNNNINYNIVSKIATELYNVIQIDGSTTISLSLLLHRYNTFKTILGGRNLQQLIHQHPNTFNNFIDEIYVYNNETFIRNKCILQRGTNSNDTSASSTTTKNKETSDTIIISSSRDDNNNNDECYSIITNVEEDEYQQEDDPNYLSKRRMDIENDETGLYSLASGKWGNAVMTCIKEAIRVHSIKQQQYYSQEIIHQHQQDNTTVAKNIKNSHKINSKNLQQSNHNNNNNNKHIALVVDLTASVGGMTLAIARRLRMTTTTTTTTKTSTPTPSGTILKIDDTNSDSHTTTTRTAVHNNIDDDVDVPDIVTEQILPQTNTCSSRTTKIIAVEIDPHRATLCKQNMIKYGYCTTNNYDDKRNIEVWNMDAMDAIPKIPFNTFVQQQQQQQLQSNLSSDCIVIVLDPPWGGIHYRYDKKQQYMMGQWTLEDTISKVVNEFQSQLLFSLSSSIIKPKTTNQFSSIQVPVLFISLRMPVFFDVDQFTTSLRDERNLIFDIEIVRKIGFQLVLVLSFTANTDL